MTGRTITEKILAAHCDDADVQAGAIVTVHPDVVLLNDVSGPLSFEQFDAMGAQKPFDPARIVLVADHFAPAPNIVAAGAIAMTRAFAQKHGIAHFYEPGRGGIEHTLLAELGMVGHGGIVFGADSHTCTAGAFNALGIGFGSTDLAGALALGKLWMRVPDSIRVTLSGTPRGHVTGKDIVLELIRRVGSDGASDAALEFGGPGLANLPMDARMAIANMAVEAGADTCVFEGDMLSKADMIVRGMEPVAAVMPDPDAT
ncbi:MAG: 3-isopropylmalate dehydratase large subunit, partial [Rhodospirillales bacterium 12-71-4]